MISRGALKAHVGPNPVRERVAPDATSPQFLGSQDPVLTSIHVKLRRLPKYLVDGNLGSNLTTQALWAATKFGIDDDLTIKSGLRLREETPNRP